MYFILLYINFLNPFIQCCDTFCDAGYMNMYTWKATIFKVIESGDSYECTYSVQPKCVCVRMYPTHACVHAYTYSTLFIKEIRFAQTAEQGKLRPIIRRIVKSKAFAAAHNPPVAKFLKFSAPLSPLKFAARGRCGN